MGLVLGPSVRVEAIWQVKAQLGENGAKGEQR
jgi:hypothetical protein